MPGGPVAVGTPTAGAPGADVSVRPAVVADAADIARVQGLTWRTAYRSVLPAAVLDGWDDDTAATSWATAVSAPPTAAHGVLVAREKDALVGFAAFGPPDLSGGESTSPDGPTTEVAALLVEPRWGRRGHGSRLLAAVADTAAGTGARRLQMWLPVGDTVTAGFLEAAGWARDGWVRTLDTGSGPLVVHSWHALLGEAGPS
ncbi:GNAT family N-acetyltransferase [Modestobacter sp. I12A-02628]|uniref:GNAT family N-acetyltransferase n=1 Tax=Goekera deserti TaxID=2497753 RepID=A0A7K3WIB2_9ACTN|nr:GNAT family N-acetyltransferase [Goekera deserti]NDI50502.1 GNAT family N-acetyltransferase [Goekera deserti]NEL56184.1 GNAT family N-acetyltransferase [Goekera deserti]